MSSNVPTSLNTKQKAFCEEYLKDLCAAKAARRAGYSAKTARSTGYKLMKRDDVIEYIAMLMAARSERTQITQDRVLTEVALLAFSDVTKYQVKEDGTIELAEGADPSALRALSSVRRKSRTFTQNEEPVEEVDSEIKLWSKVDALQMAGKHLGMFVDKVETRDVDANGNDKKTIVFRVIDPAPRPAEPDADD